MMKKWIAAGMAAAVAAAGLTVSAAAVEAGGILNPPKVTEEETAVSGADRGARGRPALTEEQKAAFEARRQEAEAKRAAERAKWDALSEADKQALYSLQKQELQLEIQQVNKLQALGLVDAEKAARQVERLNNRMEKVGTDGRDTPDGGKGPRDGGRGSWSGRSRSGRSTGSATVSSLS